MARKIPEGSRLNIHHTQHVSLKTAFKIGFGLAAGRMVFRFVWETFDKVGDELTKNQEWRKKKDEN